MTGYVFLCFLQRRADADGAGPVRGKFRKRKKPDAVFGIRIRALMQEKIDMKKRRDLF